MLIYLFSGSLTKQVQGWHLFLLIHTLETTCVIAMYKL